MMAERLQHLTFLLVGALCHIDIDRDGLANGSFTLLEFRAVMPDGLVLRIPEQDAIPPTRLIEELFPPSLDHLDVFVGIPMDHVGIANCQLDQKGLAREPRYASTFVSIPDFNTGENAKEVMVARKNISKSFFPGKICLTPVL